MPRPRRLETIGGLYHVMFRGNRRQAVFLDDEDRDCMLRKTRQLKARFDLEVYAYVLMPNHAHLLVRRMHDPLAGFMAALLTTFARYFNRKYGLVGHVFQGRYCALLCQDETYLLRLVRYIHRNPLRAGLSSGVDFAWSSYAAYLGQGSIAILDPSPVLKLFGKEIAEARAAFRDYHEGPGATTDSKEDFLPRRGALLGDESFEKRETCRAARSVEPPRAQRLPLDAVLNEALRSSGIRVDPIEIRGPSRRIAASLVRSLFVEMAVEGNHYRYVEVAGFLSRSPENVRTMLARRRAVRGAAAGLPPGK